MMVAIYGDLGLNLERTTTIQINVQSSEVRCLLRLLPT